MSTWGHGREISRRELLKMSGMGLGALALGRYLGGSKAFASEGSQALQLARVMPRTATQAFALSTFDDTHRRFADGSIELLLWPGDQQRLSQMGIWHQITVTDLVARDARALATAPQMMLAGPPGADTRTDYRRLADYESELAALPTQFPGLARRITLGERSLEGRDVYGIEIGPNIDASDGRPIFYIDGIHHAREWPTAEYVMSFAHHLLRSYGTDPTITTILDRARVTVVPIMNVDGFHFARESTLNNANLGAVAGGQGQYWRKNRRGHLDEETGGNPTSYGTDPNRNYPFFWGATNRGLSGIPQGVTPVNQADPILDMVPVLAATSPNLYDQTYYGSAPLSEPESRNVANYIRGNNVVAVVTNHNNAALVLRPWGHTTEPAYDEDILSTLGAELADILFSDESKSQIGLGLYPTTGTTDDWAYGATSALGYTIEHGGSGFHPSYNGTDGPGREANWTKAMNAFIRAAEVLTETANHAVITGRATDASGAPVQATLNIHKEFDTPMWPEGADGVGPLLHQGADVTHEVLDFSTTTAADGVIEWHVNPSTRPLEAKAGRTETYKLKVTANGSTKESDILLRRGDVLNLGDLPF
ncbi:MAG: M14 family zinc carboxypeptidase [Actinomycetota bacterium]